MYVQTHCFFFFKTNPTEMFAYTIPYLNIFIDPYHTSISSFDRRMCGDMNNQLTRIKVKSDKRKRKNITRRANTLHIKKDHT